MKNKNKYLASEASFQDSKIEYNVRKELDKYYSDSAYKYKNQYIFDVIGNVEGKRILDLGCGAGYTSLKLLKKGAHVTAIDISPKSIEHLAGEVKALGMSDRITALVMDAHNLQFDDGYFDLVVGDGILHHLPDLEKALAEIKRVLKPTGRTIFNEPLGMNPILCLYRAMTPKLRTKDEQPFRQREIQTALRIFPNAALHFFDCFTLLSKPFIALRLTRFATKLQKYLIKLDEKLIRKNHSSEVTFWKRMSWMVVLELQG